MKTKDLANYITLSRIGASFILLVTEVFSPAFLTAYLYSGFSDMIDGAVARKLHADGSEGARLDSIADTVFVGACALKILPAIKPALWLWIWIVVIALIKVSTLLSGYVCNRSVDFLHTTANKITGFLLFLLPLVVQWAPLEIPAVVVCAAATFAAIQEGHFIRSGRNVEKR